MNRQQEAERALHDQTNILPRGKLLMVFAGLAISLIMSFVDQNGISVTLPTIAGDLNAQSSISWAGTSSLIANTMFTVLYGRLSDIFGRKVVYLSALALLSIADLVCGFAQNPAMFYVFRGLAGIGGGGVASLAMIIVSDVVTLQERGKYQGILGAAIGISNIIGPFIAAAFVMESTWRGYFWLLSPLIAVSMGVGYFLIPNNARKDGFRTNLKRIDYFGILASSIAVIFILLPISGGGAYFEWNSPMVISMLAIGGCSLVAFIFIEWKVALLPMLPVSFFKDKVLCALFLQCFLLGAVYQSYLYYLPMYYQNARAWSPIVSAALVTPMVGCQSVASILSGQYISRMKRYGEVVWLGFGMWTLGAGLALLFDRDTNPGVIAVIIAIVGIGVGFTFQPNLIACLANCTKAQRAVVVSDRNYFRCLGGACGLAISAAILQSTLRSNLPPGYKHLVNSTYTLPARATVADADWEQILTAYAKASRSVFILQVPLIGVCFLACVFIRDRGLESRDEGANSKAQQQSNTEDDPESNRTSNTDNAEERRVSEKDPENSPCEGPSSNNGQSQTK